MAVRISKRRSLALVLLFVALALLAAPSDAQAQPPSGCEICRDKGECAMAFAGQPGQFCGNWLDASSTRRPCCCAIQDTCVRDVVTDCKCQKGKKPASAPAPAPAPVAAKPTPAPTAKKDDKSKLFIAVGVVVFAILVGVLVFMYIRKKRESEEAMDDSGNFAPSPVVVQTTYPAQPQYAQAPPAPVYAQPPAPAYAPAPVYTQTTVHVHESPRRGGGGFNGAGVAVGAAAGLVGGMLIGHALADGGHDNGGGDDNNDDGAFYAGDF